MGFLGSLASGYEPMAESWEDSNELPFSIRSKETSE